MSNNSINTRQKYLLDGVEINASEEWRDATIVAEYDNDSIQPSISIDSFTFNLEARTLIKKWISGGNIFEGMPLKITLFNNTPSRENFKSILNFTEGYEDLLEEGKVRVAIEKEDGLISFFDKIGSISFGYLEDIGFINDSDYTELDYVVQKKLQPLEILISAIVIYLLVKEIAESIKSIAESISQIAAYAASGITGTVGAAIYAVASAIIQIIYAAALVAAVINLATDLFRTLIPPKRTHKVFPFKKMLEKVCSYYGFGFVTSVTLYDNLVYLPSNNNLDTPDRFGFIETPRGTTKGIPTTSDRGYICSELFELAKEMCDGKFAIIGNDIHLRPKDDSFWIKQSTFKLPNVLLEKKEYNSTELNSSIILSFKEDTLDDYTFDNFRGTVVEIKTDIKTPKNEKNSLLKGFEDIPFGVALGTRKDKLSGLEKILEKLGGTVDKLTSILRRGTNFSNKVKTRVGLLKTSNNNHSVAKLVYVNGSSMPSNHRDLFSAPVLWNSYYGDKSFVRNEFKGQKALYKGVRIPFGLEAYKTLTENSYFEGNNGADAKIEKIEWLMESDTAIIDFWVREVYSKNLKETIIIPT